MSPPPWLAANPIDEMFRKIILSLAIAATVLLASCKFKAVAVTPMGDWGFAGEIDTGSGEPAKPDAEPFGDGEITLDDGTVVKGKFYDTNGDGKPDKFKPDKGEGGDGAYGESDGDTWYDLDDVKMDKQRKAGTPIKKPL